MPEDTNKRRVGREIRAALVFCYFADLLRALFPGFVLRGFQEE